MQIDIAIVNYHSADQIADCLVTLGGWEGGKIWLVDNSCDTEEAHALHALAKSNQNVHVLVAARNLGFAQGCNLAFAQSTADFLLLLNPDAFVTGSTVVQLAEAMRLSSELGAMSPTIYWNRQRTFVTPPTMAQTPWTECCRLLSQAFGFVAKGLAWRHLQQMRQIANASTVQHVEFLSGAVLMVRREAVLDAAMHIQGVESESMDSGHLIFDPAYFMFFEDSDFSLRLRKTSWKLGILPTAHAVHEYRHRAFKANIMQQSRHIYFKKRFALFYRWTRRLSIIDSFAAKLGAPTDYPYMGVFSNVGDFAYATKDYAVIALSASVLMVPAIFRPQGGRCTPLNEQEWGLLESGHYTACLRSPQGQHYWVNWTLLKL